MKKQNIEDIFSSMEDFSSVPPPELWGKIEEKLDQPKKKKKVVLWWSAAACLLLGLLLPSVLHFKSESGIKTINNGAIENNSVVLEKKNKESNDSKTITTKDNNEKVTINKTNPEDNLVEVENTSDKNTSNPSQTNQKARNTNQAVAEKSFVPAKENAFLSVSKYQISNTKKTATDKILSQKSFGINKANRFNSNNKMSNSIFEDQLTPKNNNNIAFNVSNSNQNQSGLNGETKTPKNEIQKSEKVLADNQKNNSKFNNVLSKQDSVQLAELQNLEKGIITPDSKKDKEKTPLSNAEKWAVEVFAGVASSENYKNDKTLGSTNDSKQSSTYGVKTKYKINKKWAVGSGLKINELGQSVANVSYMDVKNSAFMTSSDYFNQNVTTAAPQIASNPNYVFVSNNTSNALKSNNIQSDNLQSGNLDQSLRYIEMPLEVSYAVFTKSKASISLNTGGFVGKLISNNVALDGNSIGQNVNANDFVYGSTLSSTVQYRVYKKTNVFVEPAMNYYMNPLNSQSFNQFQWGLNFGLNVSF